ncbi:hypothetical protein BLI708_11115 [Bifidobacterium imperatoris]|uniref:site-specific DNA-methyltransferase (adenine-specific) n=1 Tax=Bifidobacterium imperatoris TaxID=2020965 RepID=A0A2N5IT73_9BIFI|nr:class I SAM-dependent DNA methyltransferase [Bifidobacterium imperatoris]PLS25162.1 restriction endonuclease subunit M [Bifidobacterium imperatoris]QSY57723.1 hypothetical protein BLI708_11115 [Bifidobacterium imperatoris]
MSTEELNETFPGLESVNDFYTPFYLQEYFPKNVQEAAKRWANLPADQRPTALIRAQRSNYASIINGEDNLLQEEAVGNFIDGLLDALGYDVASPTVTLNDPNGNIEIPLRLNMLNADGKPQLQVVTSLSTDADSGILESPSSAGKLTCEACVNKLFADFDEPARWVLVLGLHQAALIDRRKWGEKKCLLIDFDTLFSRNQQHVYEAVAVLLHRASLCPQNDESVLDSFDESSSRQAVAVSDSLKTALRECVEILGNEVIYDQTVNQHQKVTDIDADELTVQCLRYMYRLLFLLFIEAKPELGYAPMKSEAYRTAYSLESLRDIAEQMRGRMDEAENTTYLADTLRKLDHLVFDGYPASNAELKRVQSNNVNAVFLVPPLKAHIFDPERTPLIEHASLRDTVMLQIIDLMSVTSAGQQTSRGKRTRKQRISYAALGINQMGAVYEALLSYRGFIAKERLYEVKRATDKFDPLDVGYFVNAEQLDEYSEDERVRYEDGPHAGEPRVYEPGTFIYRLAGRERETSASFYTPDSLAECLVRYALKEIEPHIHQATDLLKLKICEPAMGSATFLNETINQLASKYLAMREKERIAQEGPSAAIPAEHRQAELQRVKMFIADRNIYGVDLNPIAVELGEVSLWLNTICDGSFVPWFGTQLQCGNSLIGARRVGYTEAELKAKTKNGRWYEREAKRIGFSQSSSSTKRMYRFLTGDPGMCSYGDKTVKAIETANLETIKTWKKAFTEPYTSSQINVMKRLSKVADDLWRGQITMRRELEQETRDQLTIYGYGDVDKQFNQFERKDQESVQGSLDAASFASENLNIREKDELLATSYRSEHARNASEYARLKLAMDYWCALWFWPIEKANQLPSRSDYLSDMSMILTGSVSDADFNLIYEHDQFTFDEALEYEESPRDYVSDHKVNLDELRNGSSPISERIKLVEQIAKDQHFFHWELEFADVFKDGGFDFMIGNPPWVNVQWNANNAVSDVEPSFAIHAITAAEMNKRLPALLENEDLRKTLLHEYVGVAGQLAFFGAVGNYPLLQGQRTNLFRCFLPNAFVFTREQNGVSAFVHPDEVYGDTRAGILREQMVRRLRYHFQFINEKKLFVGVDHHTAFSLNVYQNPESNKTPMQFDSIWNLYAPKTIDECYASDGTGEIPTIKDENGNWNTRGHHDRIIQVDEHALKMFSTLVGDGTSDSWKTTPMVGVYARALITALERMAEVPQTLRDYDKYVTYSPMWNETNARKDGTIKDDIHFPTTSEPIIYSSPFIGVGNPILQSTRRNYRVNSDYDFVDLTTISEDYEPRVKYAQACSDAEYTDRVQKMANGSRFDAVYRLGCRRMVPLAGERTLQAAGVHPSVAWVNTIAGYGVHPERYALLALMSGLEAALPYDFLVRSIGKMDIHNSTLQLFPVPESCLSSEIALRGLLLNCVTKPYAELWETCWEDAYATMSWAKTDSRLKPEHFTQLTREWDWNTPLRTDYERRQALVELDVLASMALGLTLDELIDIYRLTFTVLKSYEDDTWYDANGRITFSKKNYGDLTYKRGDFGRIKNAKAGTEFIRTITDDTQPDGPTERIITYVAPFDLCDRIADYRTAWAFFEHKYADQLATETHHHRGAQGVTS